MGAPRIHSMHSQNTKAGTAVGSCWCTILYYLIGPIWRQTSSRQTTITTTTTNTEWDRRLRLFYGLNTDLMQFLVVDDVFNVFRKRKLLCCSSSFEGIHGHCIIIDLVAFMTHIATDKQYRVDDRDKCDNGSLYVDIKTAVNCILCRNANWNDVLTLH